MTAVALTALGVAGLHETARIARIAAHVRRRGPVTPELVRVVCEELCEPATGAVAIEVERQQRVHCAKPRPWIFVPPSLDERRAAIVRRAIGGPDCHEHPYGSYLDVSIVGGAVLALVQPYGQRSSRVTLVVKLRGQELVRVRVPPALRTLKQVMAWLVAEDLPDSPAGDDLWKWVLERSREEVRRG